MTVLLFWNVARKPLYEAIAAVCRENEVDILILAEFTGESRLLLKELNARGGRGTFFEPYSPNLRLKFLIRYPPDSLSLVADDPHIAIRRLRPPVGQEILICAAHLPSKLHQQEYDQGHQARRLSDLLRAAENRHGLQASIVIGDLNMDPFEDPLVAADGLHAVMDKTIALAASRRVQGAAWPYLYNPMWSRLGDDSAGPPGTYFYSSGRMVNHFWHTFDQVLIRPELLALFPNDGLKVITRVGGDDLISTGKISSNFSDHLPICVRLDLARGIQ
jgi:hypothetical protein